VATNKPIQVTFIEIQSIDLGRIFFVYTSSANELKDFDGNEWNEKVPSRANEAIRT